jgi:hypothetical protein
MLRYRVNRTIFDYARETGQHGKNGKATSTKAAPAKKRGRPAKAEAGAVKRGRGRPPKADAEATPKRRGRPPGQKTANAKAATGKRRGRPPGSGTGKKRGRPPGSKSKG